eukprot:symbB.v1.2.013030.t1/scaffold913.1/size152782/8
MPAKEPSKRRRRCCGKLRLQSSKKDLNGQMTGAVTDVTLPASLSVRQKFEFSNQITMPAAHHCKTWLCAPSQLEDGQDSSSPPFFLIHGPIGLGRLGNMMCKVLSRQRVFMKQLLGYCTRVTLRSSPREDDENLNLVNSCVGHAETALVSSPCTFL